MASKTSILLVFFASTSR